MKSKNNSILLVNPCLPSLPKEVVSTPFGIAWISAVLKKNGFKVDVLDMQVEPSFDKLESLLKLNPLLVGVSHVSNFSMGWSCRVDEFIHKLLPDTPIIAGGVGATYEPSHVLANHGVSAVVIGEGEYTFLKLAQLAKKNNGKLTPKDYKTVDGVMFFDQGKFFYTSPQPAIPLLDELPLPDRSIFNMNLYPQGAIITSRGCSHNCAFCSSSNFWGNITGKKCPRVRIRSAKNVLKEIHQLKNEYGINQFYILDDVFTVDRQRVIDICISLIDQKMDVKWACLARGDQVDLEMLKLMKKAGCSQIHFGLESANDQTLQRIGKGITADKIGQALTLTKKAGLRTRVSVILGIPGDTKREIHETIDFLELHRPNEVQFYALMPYPGSKWGDNPQNFDIHIIQPDSNKRVQSVMEPFAETSLLPESLIKKLAIEGVKRLEKRGYTHLTGHEKKLKAHYEYVVSSAFTPIQSLDQYANISDYLSVLKVGPVSYEANKN